MTAQQKPVWANIFELQCKQTQNVLDPADGENKCLQFSFKFQSCILCYKFFSQGELSPLIVILQVFISQSFKHSFLSTLSREYINRKIYTRQKLASVPNNLTYVVHTAYLVFQHSYFSIINTGMHSPHTHIHHTPFGCYGRIL